MRCFKHHLPLVVACVVAIGCSGGKKEEPKKSTGTTPAAKKTTPKTDKPATTSKPAPKKSGPQEWGTLKGRFVVDGDVPAPVALKVDKDKETCCAKGGCPKDNSLLVDASGGLANVAIYLRDGDGVPVHPSFEATANEPVTMDNVDCMFKPHVAALRTSQPLMLKNSDPIGHNAKLVPVGKNPEANPLLQPGQEIKYEFSKGAEKLPSPVSCSIHPWMKGYVLAVDSPYFAVTGPDGSFEIANVPAGVELEFQLWHERSGYLIGVDVDGTEAKRGRVKLTVEAGENDLGEIKVPAAKLASS
ncbi:MAG: hypothetical protein MI757_09405 [Pirellulales bacterium]|nr:hypothetical protein [Pirellulales bacterium]